MNRRQGKQGKNCEQTEDETEQSIFALEER